jgi:hypothetical protein
MRYRITIPVDGEAVYEVEAGSRVEALNIIRVGTQKEAPGTLCVSAPFTLLYCGARFEIIDAPESQQAQTAQQGGE